MENNTTSRPPSGSTALVLGLTLFAIVMLVSLFFTGVNAAITVVATAGFYGGIIILVVLIDSGTLEHWITGHQQQVTLRRYHELTTALRTTEPASTQPLLLDLSPTQPQRLVDSSNFVSATPDSINTRQAALRWVEGLYDAEGLPDPKKVVLEPKQGERPGRIWVKWPDIEVRDYLIQKAVLHDWGNALRLNIDRVPSINAVRQRLQE